MAVNCQDWLRQAQRDLDLARKAQEADSYEWACPITPQTRREWLER